MTLLELLVKRLPSMGGWPDGVERLEQYTDGSLFDGPNYQSVFKFPRVDDFGDDEVTREQYEAALAASNPEWDGEGLPPVGCVCEVRVCEGFEKCEIVFSHTKSGVAFVYLDEGNHGGNRPVDCISPIPAPSYFRPLRSEADKKRDEAVESIKAMLMYDYGDDPRLNDAVILYDAIAAGKIPHIRID